MGVQSDLLTDLKTPSEYVGYDTLKVDAAVLKDIVQDDQLTDTVNPGEARVLFDVTPFYAEMGGQVADQGVIEDADGNVVAEVVDVQHAPNGQNLHTIKAKREMHAGESFTLIVDRAFHLKVEKNHTATHLLDQALRDVLGEHTHQAGSLVEPGYLRFDFTHFGQVTDEDLQKVEEIINDKIYDEIPVTTVETDLETGKKMGAIALFDDKYGKKVRVVSVGDYSREFCGGTHVKNTNEIGLFKIVSESGVGAGVRRIEAVTSQAALEFLNGEEALLQKAAGLLKSAQVKDVPAKVEQLQAQVKDLNQTINQLEAKIAQAEVANIYDQVQEINGIRLITAEVQVSGMDQLRQMADDWKTKDQSDVLVLGAKIGEKANLIAAVKDPFVEEGLKAGDLIKAIAPKVNGGGGGRPNMAQAGGSAPEKINEALKAASEWLETQGK
jgi:alanyl-tRNA synthetase